MKSYKNQLSAVERAFCIALSATPLADKQGLKALYAEIGDDALWRFSEKEESASVVGSSLIELFGVDHVEKRWLHAADHTAYKIGLYLEQLDRVAAAFDLDGIKLVALKNSGIARGIHHNLAGCPMGDIDTLVSPRDFRRAHQIMKALGFSLLGSASAGREKLSNRSVADPDVAERENAELLSAELSGGTEYTYALSNGQGLWFELQWRPVAGRWIHPNQEPAAQELIARSVEIKGTKARLLAPEDNLLQVCLHTAKHSYVRAPGFRLHTDVDRIVRGCPIDWDVFCDRVEELGVRTAVYLSLIIPADLLETPVPEQVLGRLDFAPRKHTCMLRWLMRVGLFGPKERKWSKLGYIGFNLMLYDTVGGALRAVIPDADWMAKRYSVTRRWTLPFWYLVRAFELVLKRANT
jgi:hypothetical protein